MNFRNFPKKDSNKKNQRGFTLIEIMVSVTIFAVIMVISSESILSVFESNRKSQSLRTVMDNLNTTLEGFTRSVRFGTVYHCDATLGSLSAPRDCGGNGASSLSILDSNGDQITYKLTNNGIARSVNGGADSYLTSPDVTITNLKFRVYGSPLYPDIFQPQVIIVISGFAGNKPQSETVFNLETTVSQRVFDSQ